MALFIPAESQTECECSIGTYSSYYWLLYLVLAVLKKNYTRLCHCLPQDYMMTLNKLKQLVKLSDDFLSKLTDQPTVDLINQKIIASLVISIKSDTDALQLCDIMENIVDNKSSKSHVELLRNGNSCEIKLPKYVCRYTYLHISRALCFFHKRIFLLVRT